MTKGQRIAEAAKALVGQEMDEANFLSEVFKKAGVTFDMLRLIEKDPDGRRFTTEIGDIHSMVEKGEMGYPYYNPIINIGDSHFVFANPATGKVEEESFIRLVIAKKEIAKIMRI